MMDRRLIWFLGLLVPVLVGVPIMLGVWRKFPLSTLLLSLVWLHCVVLMVGGHYTYALVPGFGPTDALGRALGWTRNNYDKIGHFAQGFVPAILTREILLRTSTLGQRTTEGKLQGSGWLGFLVVSVCLAFSALYELIEWVTAVSQGEAAEAFLGTQGDVWDTQKDMATALVGAVVALVLLSRMHDRGIARVAAEKERK